MVSVILMYVVNEIHNNESREFLTIPLNGIETQTFLLKNRKVDPISTSKLWIHSQQHIVDQCIGRAGILSIDYPFIILPGTSHFGHFFGDHYGILVSYLREKRVGMKDYKILLINQPKSIVDFLFITEGADLFSVLNIEQPTIIHASSHALALMAYKRTNAHTLNYMCTASVHLQARLKKYEFCSTFEYGANLFLSSTEFSRIVNHQEVVEFMCAQGYTHLDPLNESIVSVCQKIMFSNKLISENGSILFNAFLSRLQPYIVLASTRCILDDEIFYSGGYKYNQFHSGLAKYLYIDPLVESAKHPFSDMLCVTISDLKRLIIRA